MTKSELCSRLESGQNDITTFFGSLSDEIFFAGSDERWSPAHHLAHLTFAHKRVTRGLKSKERLQDYTGEPKGFEEIKNNYLTALQKATSAGSLQNNPFGAQPETRDKDKEIARFSQAAGELREAVSEWSEAELDAKAMPHVLLGLLSARDILFFMIYHDQHHLQGVQKLAKV
jgi:DinB superfamily